MSPSQPGAQDRTVRLVTLGCARNEVDSEELAARLEAAGWRVVGEDPGSASAEDASGGDGASGASGDGLGDGASVVLVNTCGFIQAAKEDSIGVLLSEAEAGRPVVAAGCLAERYGAELADALPEAEVISFDDYATVAQRLDAVLAGERRPAHTPRDRRRLLPIAPAERPRAAATITTPSAGGPPSGPPVLRRRLSSGLAAPLKIASGCDRRCTFCAIPSFRGAFVSRDPADLLAEAAWLAGEGVRELVLVSENSTSYGKDLRNLRLLEELLPALAAVPGLARIRVSYLQPAEMRPGLAEVIASTEGVAPYFDLSFQHASGRVLRSMRRFGDRERFTRLLGHIRRLRPDAGIRSNFIVGFPGETRDDVDELKAFLEEARLDAIGIFGYSDEDGTAAAALPGKLTGEEAGARLREVSDLAEELMAQRAEERIGEDVLVLAETPLAGGGFEGRAAHQAPEVDGSTTVKGDVGARPGDLVRATVRASEGVDLVADALEVVSTARIASAAAGSR